LYAIYQMALFSMTLGDP